MYHSVAVIRGRFRQLGVEPALLAQQLGALKDAGYRLVGLTEAVTAAAAGRQNVVALTFDDAYVDFLQSGLPILDQLDAKATLYVPTGHVGGRAGWLKGRANQLPALLTWNGISECLASGRVEIGSHSVTHRELDIMHTRSLATEVSSSRDELEQRIQTEVDSFCYPHGYNSKPVRAAVAAAGYSNACAVGRRLRENPNRFALPRLAVGPDDMGPDLLNQVRLGGPRLVPDLKRAANPGWRVARRTLRKLGAR